MAARRLLLTAVLVACLAGCETEDPRRAVEDFQADSAAVTFEECGEEVADSCGQTADPGPQQCILDALDACRPAHLSTRWFSPQGYPVLHDFYVLPKQMLDDIESAADPDGQDEPSGDGDEEAEEDDDDGDDDTQGDADCRVVHFIDTTQDPYVTPHMYRKCCTDLLPSAPMACQFLQSVNCESNEVVY